MIGGWVLASPGKLGDLDMFRDSACQLRRDMWTLERGPSYGRPVVLRAGWN